MLTYKLRWLSLLGILGVLGLILKQELFFGMFGFAVFLPLFWYDERTESIFRRAAVASFVVGVAAFAGMFVYIGMLLGINNPNFTVADTLDLMGPIITAWALTYVLILLTFAGSYIYLERKGT